MALASQQQWHMSRCNTPPLHLHLNRRPPRRSLISDVDWAALEARLVAAWDTDGDGHVSAQGGSDAPRVPCILIWRAWNTTTLNRCLADLHAHAQRAIDILGFNLPSGAAFAAAFIAGLRAG